MTDHDPESKNDWIKKAIEGRWDDVISDCTVDPSYLQVRIPRLEDTLLHLAVSSGQKETVRKLTRLISDRRDRDKLLRLKNERGNTALHLAAMLGNVAMCKRIASVEPTLIEERNEEGETPIFVAVLFGKKQAFHCLYGFSCTINIERYNYSYFMKSSTRDTILHCAISGDHFDLALQIIELYAERQEPVNTENVDGLTPLHLLAEKPSAFRSGSRLGFFQRMIYYGIHVDEHKMTEPDDHSFQHFKQPTERPPAHINYPENYRTCNDFYRFFWNFFTFLRLAMGINVGVQTDAENPQTHAGNQESINATRNCNRFFPANYEVCCNFLKFANRIVLIVFGGAGIPTVKKIYKEKRQHTMSIQIMNKLLEGAKMSEFYHDGKKPSVQSDKAKDTSREEDQETNPVDAIDAPDSEAENREAGKKIGTETAILIAARNGVTEIVEKILEVSPVAIHDVNAEKKNVVLLAVENKQPHVYQLILEKKNILYKDRVFRVVDNKGNTAFHLAAKLAANYKPWLIPGEALQMQWEMKWFEFVTSSIPSYFVPRYNADRKTPEDVFIETHSALLDKGSKWLTKTSQSYSVVAALIATVAFATSTTVPGGVKQDTGIPTLEDKPAFHLFAISSLVALCFSVTALVMFLSILTSRNQERDFGKDLPRKLLIGLTSLFVSIAAVLISFCSGHFFVVQNKLKYVAFAVYAATCLPVTFFATVQFPLYFDLIHATFTKVPRRSYEATL